LERNGPSGDAAGFFVEAFAGREFRVVPAPLRGGIGAGRVVIPLAARGFYCLGVKLEGQKPLTLTDSAFATVCFGSEVPVLVDFWAEWCGPCRMIAPTIDTVATEYAGKVKVGKVDVDTNNATASRFNVFSIPTLLLFKNGQVVEQRVGAVGKSEVLKMIDAHVESGVRG